MGKKSQLFLVVICSLVLLVLPGVVEAALVGDANGDSKVDGVDYIIWLNHYGQSVSGVAVGDFNTDSKVDGVDYILWLNNYGMTIPIPTVTPPLVQTNDWTQQAHDAQRTGYTTQDPSGIVWSFAWHWKPSDMVSIPRGAHAVTGGNYLFMPGGTQGLYAIAKSTGATAWNLAGTFNAAGAYGTDGNLYIGSADGKLYKVNTSTGATIATFNAQSPINYAVMLVNNFAYVVTDNGKLYKVDVSTMTSSWVYAASGNSKATTPPSYSASADLIIFGTKDLYVHAVRNSDGGQRWRVKPTTLVAGDCTSCSLCNSYSFENSWPVVADLEGVVFMRTRLGDNSDWIWSMGSVVTNAEIKTHLTNNPTSKALFALDLSNGSQKFTPAVENGGVDDKFVNSCGIGTGIVYSTIGPMPVVKNFGTHQVAYIPWRSGDVAVSSWDGRWNGHMGEMVMDSTEVAGFTAGDMRYIKFNGGSIGNGMIADEFTPITMAGNSLFHAHWGASEAVVIGDRSSNYGATLATQISSTQLPYVIRRLDGSKTSNLNTTNRTANNGLPLMCDGRYYSWSSTTTYPNSFYSWLNQSDPPATCAEVQNAYADGMRPRYTFVADGKIYVVGNGGDIFALKFN